MAASLPAERWGNARVRIALLVGVLGLAGAGIGYRATTAELLRRGGLESVRMDVERLVEQGVLDRDQIIARLLSTWAFTFETLYDTTPGQLEPRIVSLVDETLARKRQNPRRDALAGGDRARVLRAFEVLRANGVATFLDGRLALDACGLAQPPGLYALLDTSAYAFGTGVETVLVKHCRGPPESAEVARVGALVVDALSQQGLTSELVPGRGASVRAFWTAPETASDGGTDASGLR